jgi:predicted RNase H-related nuclease YkuK (DUF458 family)
MSTIFTSETKFTTGSWESITLAGIVDRIGAYLSDGHEYTIDIGTDSQRGQKTKFVTAIVIHKIGKGAIFFYHPVISENIHTLQDRIYMETAMSINCAAELLELFVENDVLYNITIHCDIGPNGKTRELIREIIGYVTASGFDCKIKPEATAACTVADRFSK